MALKNSSIKFLKEQEGTEEWTDAFEKRFDERVCVGIEYPYCWNRGKKFKPTETEWRALMKDITINEWGSISNFNNELKKEFGLK